METLKLRILIKYVQGETIAYLYNREAFDLLNIEKQQYDNSQFIEAGNQIEYENKKYIVESVNLKMCPETYEANPGYGVNLYSPTEQADYNCQLGVFVNDLE